MFKRGWVKYAPLGALAIAVLVAFSIFVWWTRPQLDSETKPDSVTQFIWNCDQQEANQSVDGHSATEPSKRAPVPSDAQDQKSRAEEQASRKQQCIEQKHNDSDLRAQWRAADSASNALKVATNGYWLAVVNFAALLITMAAAFWAAWAGQRSADISAKHFVAANPPKIRISNVVIHKPGDIVTDLPDFIPGEKITGFVALTNVGVNQAMILNSFIEVRAVKGELPMRRPYWGDTHILQTELYDMLKGQFDSYPTMDSGQSEVWNFDGAIHDDFSIKRHMLYIMGFVRYLDDNTSKRVTVFCRRYDPKLKQFVAVDNPDYETEE